MARNSGLYGKRRVKTKKQDTQKAPFNEELDNRRNKKMIIAVISLVVFALVATLILPYFQSANSGSWSLPDTALKTKETVPEVNFTPQTITLSQTYTRKNNEYYVLFGTKENTSSVESKLVRSNYFTVDPTVFENKSLLKDVNNVSKLPQKPLDIKIVKDLALIKIKNGKAIDFINNKNDVIKYVDKIK